MKEVRPTSGRVLLALMSILGTCDGRIKGSFLDLFAGTGRVGLEAAERGADPVFFVETLRVRAQKISAPNVLNMDVRRGLAWLEKKELSFDIIFADPPYNEGWGGELPAIIEAHPSILKPGGIFIFEHSEREKIADFTKLQIKEIRKYGETALLFAGFQPRA